MLSYKHNMISICLYGKQLSWLGFFSSQSSIKPVRFRCYTKNWYTKLENVFHHIGIYIYKVSILEKFVSLKQSSNELKFKLEQLRALENKMSIHVGFINSCPLSVDTEEDLIEIKKLMEKK